MWSDERGGRYTAAIWGSLAMATVLWWQPVRAVPPLRLVSLQETATSVCSLRCLGWDAQLWQPSGHGGRSRRPGDGD
ncbi:hypothetical protein [Neosynechococcus sphagnicola]|uniref:hypothetical protein n=1 Tax=Neosynechococcus sphagnicola TaxID=1501145 RepID=UPI00195532CB|nr:hypothetical protein [Neosynechococcus sphagnicola]